jgi:hypothetical protein
MKKEEKGGAEGGRETENICRSETDRTFPVLKVPKQSLLILIRVILTERKSL